jgi:hypothetical protein
MTRRTRTSVLAALALFVALTIVPGASAASYADTSWRVLVLIYDETQFQGVTATMTSTEKTRAADAVMRFAGDVPVLSSGHQTALFTIRYPAGALTNLVATTACGGGYWAAPQSVASEVTAQQNTLHVTFDSVIVIWPDHTATRDFQACGGLSLGQHSDIPVSSVSATNQNILKHEWGHQIVGNYADRGLINDVNLDRAGDYRNCSTNVAYIASEDDSKANAWYNDSSGFMHDIYSGTTEKTGESLCRGVTTTAWNAGPPHARPRKEFLRNQSFEVDANGNGEADIWVHNTHLSRSASNPRTGFYSLRHSTADAADFTLYQTQSGVVAGRTYDYSCWTSIGTTSDTFSIKATVLWRNSAGTIIRTDSVRTLTGSTGGWSAVSKSGMVAPTGSASVRVQYVGVGVDINWYLDDCSLAER